MAAALEEAVRRVLDHGRSYNGHVEISVADYHALAGTYKAANGVGRRKVGEVTQAAKVAIPPSPAQRDPAYEREMRRLFDNAELNP